MSDQAQYFDLAGPVLTKTACIAVTSTTTKPDLSADANVGQSFLNGELLAFHADGADIYFGFSYDDSTVAALDETATGTAAGRCMRIPEGQTREYCMPWINGNACKYLYAKTKSGLTATLRISPASLSFENRIG